MSPLFTMIALIDGDTIAYRCAASCEPTKQKLEREPLEIAIQRADELCYRILSDTDSGEYRLFISGSDNFREAIYPDYKANRRNTPKPEYLNAVREFLLTEWKAEITAGIEADDAIGIAANENTIICANDKDFRQIPGRHYNFVKAEFFDVNDYEAALAFWSSMLIGDTSDNVKGVEGIGPVKAARNLVGLSPEEMEDCVRRMYSDDERFAVNYRLLRLIRSDEELNEVLYENAISKGEGPKPTKDSGGSNPSVLPTVD